MADRINYAWKVVRGNLHIEARATKRGINYGLLTKIPPGTDPVKAIRKLRTSMLRTLEQNREYVAWLNEGAAPLMKDPDLILIVRIGTLDDLEPVVQECPITDPLLLKHMADPQMFRVMMDLVGKAMEKAFP